MRIQGPAGRLFVDDGGREDADRLPVVCVHSFGGNTGHWDAQLACLRRERRASAFDMRGHGRSDAPRDGDYSIAAAAADVGAVLDALDLQRSALIGHSQGALVALAYAALHGERVPALLLLDPPPDPAGMAPEVRRQIEGYLAGLVPESIDRVSEGYLLQIAGPNEATRNRLLADLRATPRETVVRGGVRAILEFDPKPSLRRYGGELRCIVTPQNDAPNSLHRVVGARPHDIVAGTGHWLQLDRPAEVNRLCEEFLATTGRSGSARGSTTAG